MPNIKNVIVRRNIIDGCLRNRYAEFTYETLLRRVNEKLEEEGYATISERTLKDDLNEIEAKGGLLAENLFQGKKKILRYKNPDCKVKFLEINDIDRKKIYDAIDALDGYSGDPQYDWIRLSLMQVDSENFMNEEGKEFVQFERNADMEGLKYFQYLLKAIIDKQPLTLKYQPYGKDERLIHCYPYFLKQYNNRWFLIAKTEGIDSLSNYALDRLNEISKWNTEYIETDEDLNDYFYDVVGVSVSDEEPEEVILKVDKKRFQYIRTKPLHGSQKVVADDDEYVLVQIKVQLNRELEALILSYGNDIEVIRPESLRARIADKIIELSDKYRNSAENLQC